MTVFSWSSRFRRRRLPAGLRPPLEPEERIIAWAPARGDDATVVVTNRGVFLPGRAHRLGWHEIHKAVWSGRELVVTPAAVVARRDGYDVVADQPTVRNLLLEPDNVPHQVRSRVTRSVAYTAHHPLPGGGVRVVGRRVSGENGLTWAVRYDPGTDAEDPEVLRVTDELVAMARAGA